MTAFASMRADATAAEICGHIEHSQYMVHIGRANVNAFQRRPVVQPCSVTTTMMMATNVSRTKQNSASEHETTSSLRWW